MINYLRDEILNLSSYQVQENSNYLKMDAMELPFGIDDKLQQQLINHLNIANINRYPSSHNELKRVIKDLMCIDKNLDIMLGNGSDELIQIIMLSLKINTQILSFKPSFAMYEMIAKWCNLFFQQINLDEDFEINIDKTLSLINNQPSAIFISYPNNPTGNCFNKDKIKKILNTNAFVIIDEAYYAYNDNTFINEINNYDNLIILRTISKIGFAGLRLGIMIAKKEVIKEFNKVRMPYNINSLTLNAAKFLLTKKDVIKNNTIIIKNNKNKLLNSLNTIKNIKTYKTDANFIFFIAKNANKLHSFLLDNNILIKNLNGVMPNALRVNISNNDENNLFLTKVKQFYE